MIHRSGPNDGDNVGEMPFGPLTKRGKAVNIFVQIQATATALTE